MTDENTATKTKNNYITFVQRKTFRDNNLASSIAKELSYPGIKANVIDKSPGTEQTYLECGSLGLTGIRNFISLTDSFV